jgi:TonB family protein
MIYRALAFTSSLFLAGCGSAAPAKEATAPASSSTASAAAASEKPAETAKAAESPPRETAAPAASGSAGKPGRGADANGAAVNPQDQLSGSLSQDEIRQILEKNGDVFGDCYNLGAGGKNKDFRATVKVKATLGPSGSVNFVQVLKSTAKNPKVDACVSDAFKKIKFPAPKNGSTSVVTFPISFNGLEVAP